MNKIELENYLSQGMSTREIGVLVNKHHNTVAYWIHKYQLDDMSRYKKTPNYQFGKIDTKEKAYALGFILADSSITLEKSVELSIQKSDIAILHHISELIGGNIVVDNTFDKKARRFPRARLVKKINDINKFIGGCNKADRHYPIVNANLERYLLLGLFDADGCITWGIRKDKNRLWQKISFTSSLKILTGLQQFLLKQLNISTIIRPKKDSHCYIIEFANKHDVLKFLNYLYCDNYFILERKYSKANALRLELEENDEGAK